MILIHFFAILTLLLCVGLYMAAGNIKLPKMNKNICFAVFGAALLLRIILAYTTHGFSSDIACFASWSEHMFSNGPGGFYTDDYFCDYPPGYLLILWFIGAIRNLLGIEYYSDLHVLLLKLPAILCDMGIGALIFTHAKKKFSEDTALLIACAYLFLPPVILNSSCWGQVDSVYTLLIVLMCICLMEGKMFPAYLAFGFGILIKPQVLAYAPVLLLGILDNVIVKDFSRKRFFQELVSGLAVIGAMAFYACAYGFENVWNQYFSTISSYTYAAVNAYNFWGLWGLNWISQDTLFGPLSCRAWGTIAIIAITCFALFVGIRWREKSKYFLLSGFLILMVFVFSVRMHERYMYPGLALLLFAYIYRPNKKIWICFSSFSFFHFYNAAHTLYFYDPENYNRTAPIILFTSAGMVLSAAYLYRIVKEVAWGTASEEVQEAFGVKQASEQKEKSSCFRTNALHDFFLAPKAPTPSAPKLKFKKLDLGLLLGIMIIYSAFALYDLGDMEAPETTYSMSQGEVITLEFSEDNLPTTLAYYIGPWHDREFTLETKTPADTNWTALRNITLETVFTWKDIALSNIEPELKLTLSSPSALLIELTFLDAEGNIVEPLNAADYPTLFDESNLHPTEYTFRNSMYFDEVYHARTAYEFIHGLTTYENTHPPLGKILISIGILIFGMNPFGWRIIGTVFGILMLPFFYLFAKKMTENTPASAVACALFAFDFMHFAQTRLATIDVYITFFVIAMYFFMFCYAKLSFYDTNLWKTFIPLGLSGLSMGLGVASKWTGVYAGLGLAVIFFAILYRRYREYLYAKQKPGGSTNGISHKYIVDNFKHHAYRTIDFCTYAFVALPVVIYTLSYLPFRDNSGNGLIKRMLDNQVNMFSYHSELVATHPYSSSWYEWPIMKRPIWYYSRVIDDTMREGISAFGNPLVWWVGIPAFLFLVYLVVGKIWAALKNPATSTASGKGNAKSRFSYINALTASEFATAAFLIIGYLAEYVPWMGVTRITFIYHYFPSVPFVVLMIVFSMLQLGKRVSKRTFVILIVIYAICAFGMFLLFYPVLAGQAIDYRFVAKFLRWFDSWVLVSGG